MDIALGIRVIYMIVIWTYLVRKVIKNEDRRQILIATATPPTSDDDEGEDLPMYEGVEKYSSAAVFASHI